MKSLNFYCTIIFSVLSFQLFCQETFNVIYNNELIENGSQSPKYVFSIGETTYSFGTIADADVVGVGIVLSYSQDGTLLESLLLDSEYDSLNVDLGVIGGAYFDEEDGNVYFPYVEFEEDGPRIRNNAIAKFLPPDDIEIVWHQQPTDSMSYTF